MRLLQLTANGSSGEALDLHPKVTVVTGLNADGRSRLVRAVAALPRGESPGCHGLVEAHGVLLDLTADSLALLDLHGDLDAVVRATDIPGAASVAGAGVGLPRSVERLTPEQLLERTPEGVHPELDQARRAHRDAQAARTVLREAAESARVSYDAALERRAEIQARMGAAEPRPRLHLVGSEASPPPAPSIDPEQVRRRRGEIEERIAEQQAELDRVERGLTELSAIDPRPVQVLLDAIRNPGAVEYVPSDRAQHLAEEFVRLRRHVAVLEEDLEREGRGTASALARLESARTELADAERAMRKPEMSDEDRAELEAAHEAVSAAELRVSGTFGKRYRRQLDQAIAREREILDRIGFPTWSAYVMGANLLAIDPAAEQRLQRARLDLEAAEEHWAYVAAAIEADPVHRALLDELEAVYLEAFDLLGGDDSQDDLEGALRALRVPKRELSIEELSGALAYQLELIGLQVGESPSVDRTVVAAEAFLAEVGGIGARLDELEGERAAVESDLAALARELDELPDLDALADLEAQVDLEAQDAAADEHTESDAAGLEVVGDDPDDEVVPLTPAERSALVVELVEVGEAVEAHGDQLEARQALVEVAGDIERSTRSHLELLAARLADEQARALAEQSLDTAALPAETAPEFDDTDGVDAGAESVEFYLLARLAALRAASYAGSVPLVIDDALADLPEPDVRQVLQRSERLSESVGFNRAAVVHAPAGFA
ncbi:MAG: hypothetical protein MUF83_14130 [Acidimicrobiales bacterium]|nr:hypothetical protein [Acidimicrobiales bacterium]